MNQGPVNITQVLNEKREFLKAEVQRQKDEKIARRDFRPCVFLGGVAINPKAENWNDKVSIKVKRIHISGGHKKPASIINLQRKGQVVLDYYIPTEEQLQKVLASVTDDDMIAGDVAEYAVTRTSPYAQIRKYLEQEKQKLDDKWGYIETREEKTELEKRALAAEAELAKLKQESKQWQEGAKAELETEQEEEEDPKKVEDPEDEFEDEDEDEFEDED